MEDGLLESSFPFPFPSSLRHKGDSAVDQRVPIRAEREREVEAARSLDAVVEEEMEKGVLKVLFVVVREGEEAEGMEIVQEEEKDMEDVDAGAMKTEVGLKEVERSQDVGKDKVMTGEAEEEPKVGVEQEVEERKEVEVDENEERMRVGVVESGGAEMKPKKKEEVVGFSFEKSDHKSKRSSDELMD